jgi:alpha-tubulin suppressor-like RCC1 family protein
MNKNCVSTAIAAFILSLTSTVQAQSAGTVVAWGWNGDAERTVPVAAQSGVTAIAAGWFNTVALKTNGEVIAWGWNLYGQPMVPLAAQSGVIAIAAGSTHSVALKQDGSVVAWGDNFSGQTTVPVVAQSEVTAIAAGGASDGGFGHTVALKNDGSVVAWGNNDYGQTTVPVAAQSGVTAIAAGGFHTVALKNDGTLVTWGASYYGVGTVPAGLGRVTAISAGEGYTAALKTDGTVVAWGNNDYGQTTVPVAAQSGVTAIAAGGGYWSGHTVALKNDGTVVAWGANDSGETAVPAGLNGVMTIAAGATHTVALVIPTAPIITTPPVSQTVNVGQSASFTVTATGYPLSYQWRKDALDLAGATSATYSLTLVQTNLAGSYTVVVSNPAGSVTSAPPAVLTVGAVGVGTVVEWGSLDQAWVPAGAQSGVAAIAAGTEYTLALKSDGSVLAWGRNESGEVTGTSPIDGTWYTTANPVTLGGQILSGVTAIAAGTGCGAYYDCAAHSVALKNDGSVVAWGYLDQTTVPVAAQNGVTAIAAGLQFTVALKSDGSLLLWGINGPMTVPVAAQSDVSAIAAGYFHTVALKNDGSVVAWDANGSDTNVPVTAQSGVTAIAAGSFHTVALKNDGTVVAWGWNHRGQVTGIPTVAAPYSATASPVTLAGQVLSGVTAIAARGNYTVALKTDGTVAAWGDNEYGQVTGTPSTEYPSSATANPVTLGGQILRGVTAIASGFDHTVALLGGVPLLPSLQARRSGNELVLSWSTNAVGFTLQATLNLAPPVTWIDSTNPPAVLGAQFAVTNTLAGSPQFYRLRSRSSP